MIIDFTSYIPKYEKVIYKFIHKFPLLDQEELYQEGLLLLYETLQTHDPGRSTLCTHFYHRINYRFHDLQRIYKSNTNTLNSLSITPMPYTPSQQLDTFLVEEIFQVLNEKQSKWFQYHFLNGLTYSQIAGLEDTTIAAVKNWAREAKKVLKPFLTSYWTDDEEL